MAAYRQTGWSGKWKGAVKWTHEIRRFRRDLNCDTDIGNRLIFSGSLRWQQSFCNCHGSHLWLSAQALIGKKRCYNHPLGFLYRQFGKPFIGTDRDRRNLDFLKWAFRYRWISGDSLLQFWYDFPLPTKPSIVLFVALIIGGIRLTQVEFNLFEIAK